MFISTFKTLIYSNGKGKCRKTIGIVYYDCLKGLLIGYEYTYFQLSAHNILFSPVPHCITLFSVTINLPAIYLS